MPKTFYGKKYHGRKVTKIQRAWRSRRKGTRLAKLEKKVRVINRTIERKFIDSDFIAAGTYTASFVDLGLQNISQGTSVSQRIGNNLSLKSIRINGWVNYSTTDAWNWVRILLVLFPDKPDFVPSIGDILADTTHSATSFYRRNSTVKFRILHDWRTFVNAPLTVHAQSTNYKPYQFKNITHTFKSPIRIGYTSGTTGAPERNNIQCIVIANSSIVDHPDYSANVRLLYTDA